MNLALWFHDNEVAVFPLKPRSKEPACRWTEYRGTRAQVGRMQNYGVRLGREPWPLAVVDADCPEAITWAQEAIDRGEIPQSTLIVNTARGLHMYYRLLVADLTTAPKFIHRDGLTIEFKHQGQYVVGPGSIHPSGAMYTAVEWSWRWEDIPIFPTTTFVFDDGSCGRRSTPGTLGDGFEFPEEVCAGERHDQLFKLLRSFKGLGADKNTAREAVHLANVNRCKPPLAEDHTFDRWFGRSWNLPDRPLAPRTIDALDALGVDL